MVKEALHDGVAWIMASIFTVYGYMTGFTLFPSTAQYPLLNVLKVIGTAFVVGFITHLGKHIAAKLIEKFNPKDKGPKPE